MRDQRNSDPRRLDVSSFARSQQSLHGVLAIDELPRLRASVLPPPHGAAAPSFEWTATGSFNQPVGRDAQTRLHLAAHGMVRVTCQRCLEPMAVPLAVDNRLLFVAGEAQAERLDEHSDDEDVLALPARLDLVELLEDELILALPIVPRHERCPRPLPIQAPASLPSSEPAEPESPFSSLARLRRPDRG